VPQMWASAQAADTQTAWQQVNAWRRTHDLLLHHASRLKACADELAYAWPPGKSPAAQAFVAYIDQLRTAILQASMDAATNYTAIAGVLTSLSSAKTDLGKMKEEWHSHEAASATEKIILQEAVNKKARSRMAQNDQEVLESSRRLTQLAPLHKGPVWGKEPFDAGSPGAGAVSDAQARSEGSSSASRMTAPSVSPVQVVDGQFGLAGSPVGPRSPALTDPSATGVASGSLPVSGPSLRDPAVQAATRIPAARVPSTNELQRIARPGGLSAGHAGTLGGPASTSPLAVGAGRSPGRVNPVGGVIEANRTTPAASAVPLIGGARGASQDHRDSTVAMTMYWDVAQGISPVIEPDSERPFELGPGVIGIDR
jgi:hypothetical protein